MKAPQKSRPQNQHKCKLMTTAVWSDTLTFKDITEKVGGDRKLLLTSLPHAPWTWPGRLVSSLCKSLVLPAKTPSRRFKTPSTLEIVLELVFGCVFLSSSILIWTWSYCSIQRGLIMIFLTFGARWYLTSLATSVCVNNCSPFLNCKIMWCEWEKSASEMIYYYSYFI